MPLFIPPGMTHKKTLFGKQRVVWNFMKQVIYSLFKIAKRVFILRNWTKMFPVGNICATQKMRFKWLQIVWVSVYEQSRSGFKSSCIHLNFRFRACFEQGVPWHSGNYRVWIHSQTRTWHVKNIQTKNEVFY